MNYSIPFSCFRLLILSLFILCMVDINAQSTDTNCVIAKWTDLKLGVKHNGLFSKNINSENENLLKAIQNLVKKNKLKIYNEVLYKWDSQYHFEEISSFKFTKNSRVNHEKELKGTDKCFYKLVQSNLPIADIDGYDSMRLLDDGVTMIVVYPLPQKSELLFSDITAIKIKEKRSSMDSKVGFNIDAIGFCIQEESYEIFWINWDELLLALPKPQTQKWIKFINDRKFNGFQYKQESCYQ